MIDDPNSAAEFERISNKYKAAVAKSKPLLEETYNAAKGNTFINFSGKHPNQTLTGWIPKDSKLADRSTLTGLDGKKIKIAGTIELYRGKPEIKIMSEDQLALE